MKCSDTIGNGNCAYNIMLPYYVKFMGDTPIEPEAKYVTVDKCMIYEILDLWEAGIKTTGCCCGHGKAEQAFISVRKEYSEQMLSKGYSLFPHGDNDHFRPKSKVVYTDKINKGFNWWTE